MIELLVLELSALALEQSVPSRLWSPLLRAGDIGVEAMAAVAVGG